MIAFSNPLRGPTSDAAYLRDFLCTITGPVVLVGHSYGGAVITNAATGNPNVTLAGLRRGVRPRRGRERGGGQRPGRRPHRGDRPPGAAPVPRSRRG